MAETRRNSHNGARRLRHRRSPGTSANRHQAAPQASPDSLAPKDLAQIPLTIVEIKRLLNAATATPRSIRPAARCGRGGSRRSRARRARRDSCPNFHAAAASPRGTMTHLRVIGLAACVGCRLPGGIGTEADPDGLVVAALFGMDEVGQHLAVGSSGLTAKG